MGKAAKLGPVKSKKTLLRGASAAQITAVIRDSLLNIDQALVDNDAVRESFRSVHDSTLAQYEVDLSKWDKEIARFPPTLEQYEKIKAAERAFDAKYGNNGGSVNHSLAFHLQRPKDGRDIFSANNDDYGDEEDMDIMGGGTLDDVPLSFQQSAIDSRFPSPTTASRRGKSGSVERGGPSGSVVSKKLSKAEKEEKKAWNTYEKFVARDDLFSKMVNIQAMEKEIETRLQSSGLTDMERKGLERELDRTSVRYSNYVLSQVSSYKPRLTAVKVGNDAKEAQLGDLSYLGVGMGSIKEMMSAMEESYYAGEGVEPLDDDGDMILDEDDGIYDDDDYDNEDSEDMRGKVVNDTLESYDMPDPQAWLREQNKELAVNNRSGSPVSQPMSGVEQADAAFDELNDFVSNAMAESEKVAVNDPFHFTNMQDLPVVRPSAPDPGNNERNNRSRGAAAVASGEDGGRNSPGLKALIQSNTNHVDPYFPSLESFKTKEQDNASYFMPGFNGKNFWKGVPQSSGAYWTAGRARTREEKRKDKKKKKRRKKKRKGGKAVRSTWWAEEGGGEDYGEEDYGEEGGDGEIDEEGKAEVEKMRKWKEDMKNKYKEWKGDGEEEEDYGEEFEGEEGGEEKKVEGGGGEELVVEKGGGEVESKPLSPVSKVRELASAVASEVLVGASDKLEHTVGGEDDGEGGAKRRVTKVVVPYAGGRRTTSVASPKADKRSTKFTERIMGHLGLETEEATKAKSFVEGVFEEAKGRVSPKTVGGGDGEGGGGVVEIYIAELFKNAIASVC